MTVKAVIFDWAGTMVDFGSVAPVIAMRQAFADEGVVIEDEDIRAGMGRAKRDHLWTALSRHRVAAAWVVSHNAPPAEGDVDRMFAALDGLMREAGVARATLIPGAREAAEALRARGVRIGSGTGYSRSMITPIVEAAAAQGYSPEVIVCAGETPVGRPSPLMVWKALVALGAYPAADVVKVDDAPVGVEEGKAAGCFTVGLAASGNMMGLDLADYTALTPADREARLAPARAALLAAGADLVIDTVADLIPALTAAGKLSADT